MVMIALPTMTKGLRARSERFGGGGTCSGSSAARGLRGEMGGRSLIDTTSFLNLFCARGYDASSITAKRWFRRERHQLTTRWTITDALVPPNPKELDKARLISRRRGVSGTRSIAVSTDGCSRLMVGGATLSRIARIEKIASIAPAAPSRCPVDDLVEDIAIFEA